MGKVLLRRHRVRIWYYNLQAESTSHRYYSVYPVSKRARWTPCRYWMYRLHRWLPRARAGLTSGTSHSRECNHLTTVVHKACVYLTFNKVHTRLHRQLEALAGHVTRYGPVELAKALPGRSANPCSQQN
jgi:hypothetical protein